MPESTRSTRMFLPWLRRGLGAIAARRGSVHGGRLEVPLELRVNDPDGRDPGRRISPQVFIYGPGDVIGLDPGQVLRTEPAHQTADFEPNYLAYVELYRPDVPWLFTPEPPDDAGRLRPWICLVVVRQQPGVSVTATPANPLPLLTCPRSELPDLAEAWAWAHVQLTRSGEPSGAVPGQGLEQGTSRLLCPRRLDANTAYHACIVPTFRAGREAGLGSPLAEGSAAALEPAWTNEGTVQLPVYFHWEFRTGELPDFEELARSIQSVDLAQGQGGRGRSLNISDPGWGMTATQCSPLALGGALRPWAAAPPPGAAMAPPEPFQEALRAKLNPESSAPGPVVRPPVYGAWPAGQDTVPKQGESPRWLRELNLDPRYRVAAGLGAQVIRYEQEDLMASAWEQLEKVRGATLVRAPGQQPWRALLRGSLEARQLAVTGAPATRPVGHPTVLPARAAQVDSVALRRFLRPGGPFARLEAGGGGGSERPPSVPPGRRVLPPTSFGRQVLFAPRFTTPAYQYLLKYFPDMLVSGLEQLPPESAALLEVDAAFIEAFMIGLNHEMGRELLWREFPVERMGTFFRSFWGDAAGLDELLPIAGWAPGSQLGDHFAWRQGGGQTILLIRGELLRRYPSARVYAAQGEASSDGGPPRLSGNRVNPRFSVVCRSDTTMFGFDRGHAAFGSASQPGWFFVIEEPTTSARFGLDVSQGAAPGAPMAWRQMQWQHAEAAGAVRGGHLFVGGTLQNKRLPVRAPSAGQPNIMATWGEGAAHMAAILEQAPFRLTVPASTWLPGAGSE